MSWQLYAAFVVFVIVTFYTPGPNNTMLMTSGLNFGFRRTLPHILGVNFGFAFLAMIVGFGLGVVFQTYPWLYTALKYAGAAYLIYLAVRIAMSGPVEPGGEAKGKPLTFLGGALFQWVNVKGWVIAVSAITAYAGIASYPANVLLQGLTYLVVGMGSSSTWAFFGTALRPLISSPKAVRIFNIAMAVALVASLYPVLAE